MRKIFRVHNNCDEKMEQNVSLIAVEPILGYTDLTFDVVDEF